MNILIEKTSRRSGQNSKIIGLITEETNISNLIGEALKYHKGATPTTEPNKFTCKKWDGLFSNYESTISYTIMPLEGCTYGLSVVYNELSDSQGMLAYKEEVNSLKDAIKRYYSILMDCSELQNVYISVHRENENLGLLYEQEIFELKKITLGE